MRINGAAGNQNISGIYLKIQNMYFNILCVCLFLLHSIAFNALTFLVSYTLRWSVACLICWSSNPLSSLWGTTSHLLWNVM